MRNCQKRERARTFMSLIENIETMNHDEIEWEEQNICLSFDLIKSNGLKKKSFYLMS